jgi:hypothetical protein
MAYIASATSGSPHIDDFISTMNTFLSANGWTLFDDIAADDKVFMSTGTGKEAIFIQLFKNVNQIEILIYQYWDNVGHTGFNVGGVNGDTGITATDGTAFNFWGWTDGRALIIAVKEGANYHGLYAGSLDRVHEGDIGVLQAGVSAGAGVVCTVDQSFTSSWTVGKKLMVLDQSTTTISAGEVGNEHATVVSSAAGTVTLDLAQDHQIGALIGFDPQPVFVNEGIVSLDAVATWWSTNGLLIWSGTAGHGPEYVGYKPMESIITNTDPDDRTDRFLNQPMYLYKSDVSEQEVRGKLAGAFYAPPSGVAAEDTTVLALGTYIALPVGDSDRMVWVPTF